MGAFGRQVIETGAEHRFRSDGSESVGIPEDGVVAVEVDVVEICPGIAVQPDLGQKDIAVGDGVGAAWQEVFGKVALRKVAKNHAAQMVPGG